MLSLCAVSGVFLDSALTLWELDPLGVLVFVFVNQQHFQSFSSENDTDPQIFTKQKSAL